MLFDPFVYLKGPSQSQLPYHHDGWSVHILALMHRAMHLIAEIPRKDALVLVEALTPEGMRMKPQQVGAGRDSHLHLNPPVEAMHLRLYVACQICQSLTPPLKKKSQHGPDHTLGWGAWAPLEV
jgi:hypothetical protein